MSPKPIEPLAPDFESHAPAPGQGSARSFGLVFAVFFAAVGLWPLWKGGDPRMVFCLPAAGLAVVAWLRPSWLSLPNRLWLRFGELLGRIFGPVALAIVYVTTVVPTGLIMRALGKDLLKLRWDRDAKTYWVDRNPRARGGEGMRNQF